MQGVGEYLRVSGDLPERGNMNPVSPPICRGGFSWLPSPRGKSARGTLVRVNGKGQGEAFAHYSLIQHPAVAEPYVGERPAAAVPVKPPESGPAFKLDFSSDFP